MYQRALDEHAHSPRRRRNAGVFYTPPSLVRHVLDHTLNPLLQSTNTPPRVLDPACGCGAFLVEAARRIRELRPDLPAPAIALALRGADIDPLAAALCRLSLWLALCEPDEPLETVHDCVRVADSLLDPPPCPPFDAVVGNPPFLSQLSAATARTKETAAALRARFGPSLRPYTDPAALFLHAAIESVRDGGRFGMILPVSVLASRDAAPVRARLTALGAIRSLWLDTDGAFDAGVRTIALTAERRAAPAPIARSSGADFRLREPCAPEPRPETWGPLAADLAGIPGVALAPSPPLADLAEITAGFRDEYYAVVEALQELPDHPGADNLPVIPVGMIDPFLIRWGASPAKIGGRAWRRPGIDATAARAKLAAVVAQQRRPKLLVATQSRAIEVAPDLSGACIALTPTVLVFPRAAPDLWRIGAAIASPVLAAWAAAHAFGAARSLDAIKPSASLLRAAPQPTDAPAWDAAASHFETLCAPGAQRNSDTLGAFGADACRAYRLRAPDADAILRWWLPRVLRAPSARTLAEPAALPG